MVIPLTNKNKILKIIDALGFFFFCTLVFFLPISEAAIESSFGFIYFFAILKGILAPPSLEDIKDFFKKKVNLSLLIFYSGIGLSLIVTGPLLKKSFGDWIFKWGEGVLLFYFAQIFLNKRRLKILLLIFAGVSLLIIIDGLYQKFTGIDFIRGFKILTTDKFSAITASFKHYNDFASYLGVTFFVVAGFLREFKPISLKVCIVILLLLIPLNMLFTYSRGGWLSLGLMIILSLLVYRKEKVAVCFLFAMCLSLLFIFFHHSLRERFLFTFTAGGGAGRISLWGGAISMFASAPVLGKGLGTFMHYLPQYTKAGIQYAHNCYLQILAETGLVGFLTFIYFLSEVLKCGYKKMKVENGFSLSVGLFFAFLVFLIHSFFDTQLYSLKLSILFWLIASFMVV